MAVLLEGKHAGDFILSEANGNRSRANVYIENSQTIYPGQLLGAITTAVSGDHPEHRPAATGTTVTGIAIYGITTATDEYGLISAIVRDAEINENQIYGWSDYSSADKATIRTNLATYGIICRPGPASTYVDKTDMTV